MEKLRDSLNMRYAAVAAVVVAVMATGFLVQTFGSQQASGGGYDGVERQAAYDTGSSSLGFKGAPSVEDASGDADVGSSPMFAISYDIDLSVSDVRGAMDSVSDRATDLGGRVESERFDRRYGVEGNLNILVPENKASNFVSEVESGYSVDSINRNKRDVSDRYTETSLELKNKRQELQRLEELMNQTEEVSSLIDIQERMSDLRSRIQYLEQRKADIEEDVNYVDISISFEKPGAIDTGFELRESLANAYNGVFNSFNLLIVGTGYLLPFALIVALLYGLKRIYTERFS